MKRSETLKSKFMYLKFIMIFIHIEKSIRSSKYEFLFSKYRAHSIIHIIDIIIIIRIIIIVAAIVIVIATKETTIRH